MARAAANRNPKPKAPAVKQPKPSRAVRKANRPVEDTLFFQRMRKSTKWVFALLVVVFAFSFVVAGVGSGSTGVGSVFDAFGSLFGKGGGGSGAPSLSHALKALQKNPKDAAANLEAAKAYLTKQDVANAVSYYESYVKLRPKDVTALSTLASLYSQEADAYNQYAQAAKPATPVSAYGQPTSTSQLGKALTDPLQQYLPSASQQAQQELQYEQYVQLQQTAEQKVQKTYKSLLAAAPNDTNVPSWMVQYGLAAIAAGDKTTAAATFKTFLKRFPDDPSAAVVKAKLKTLTGKS